MHNWEKFEIDCTNFLNSKFSGNVRFENIGKSDSNVPDIKVYIDNIYKFAIEAKLSIAQSGQFVLNQTQNGLILSNKSRKNSDNIYTEKIIEFINDNYLNSLPVGQKSVSLNLPSNLSANWIKEHYLANQSIFVITSNKLNSFKSIFHYSDIDKYFKIKTNLRRKKSGTHHIPNIKINDVLDQLEQHLDTLDLKIDKKIEKANKLEVKLNNENELKKSDRYFGNNLFLSLNDKNSYYVKQRSNTNNLNVIFELEYIGPEEDCGIDLLKNYIKNIS